MIWITVILRIIWIKILLKLSGDCLFLCFDGVEADYVQFKTLSWTLRVKFPLMQLKSLHFFIVTLLKSYTKTSRLWTSCSTRYILYPKSQYHLSGFIIVLTWFYFITTRLQRKAFRLWFSEGRSNGRKKVTVCSVSCSLWGGLFWFVSTLLQNTPKTGTMESLKCLVSSPYIRDLASLVVAYGISINVVEVTWNDFVSYRHCVFSCS